MLARVCNLTVSHLLKMPLWFFSSAGRGNAEGEGAEGSVEHSGGHSGGERDGGQQRQQREQRQFEQQFQRRAHPRGEFPRHLQ